MKTSLKCERCLLPNETPGIHFDKNHVCNFCKDNFAVCKPLGEDLFFTEMKKHLRTGSGADCLVGISGGKDSTFALVKLLELGFKVEAFTYVHEGSTPIALKNAKQVCKQLNVKHHIVSLDKEKHLKTFLAYFNAWMKKPSQTAAAMTCVACKYLHIFGYQIATKRNIPIIVWAPSPAEIPPFLAIDRKMKNGKFVEPSTFHSFTKLASNIISNPVLGFNVLKFLKTTALGCLSLNTKSHYLLKKYNTVTPISIFDYYDSNPKNIRNYIIKKAGWYYDKKKEDWHADCIFHVFKEYMMLKTSGVSYIEAYVSNQIRNGFITKEEGEVQIHDAMSVYKKEIVEGIHKLKLDRILPKIDLSVFDGK